MSGQVGRAYLRGDEAPTPGRASVGGSVEGRAPADAYPGGAAPEAVHGLP